MTDNKTKERQIMKLRFQVDQAECFRNGIDCLKSIVTIEVAPTDIPHEVRKSIADRMIGIDVCQMGVEDGRRYKAYTSSMVGTTFLPHTQRPLRIVTKAPTLEALIEAIREEDKELEMLEKSPTPCTVTSSVVK